MLLGCMARRRPSRRMAACWEPFKQAHGPPTSGCVCRTAVCAARLQVLVAADQGAASPLSTAVQPQEDAAQDVAIDLAEDMVSEQYCWLTNLVNFFAQYEGMAATCQARRSSSPWLPWPLPQLCLLSEAGDTFSPSIGPRCPAGPTDHV